MNWRRLHLIEDVLLPLLLIALRLCWLWPWLDLLRRWLAPSYTGPLVPLWVMGALMVGGLSRGPHDVGPRWQPGHGAATGGRAWAGHPCPAALVAVCASNLCAVGSALGPGDRTDADALGRRGACRAADGAVRRRPVAARHVDGQRTLLHDDVWSAFVFGCGAFVVLVLLAQLDPAGLPPGTTAGCWPLSAWACPHWPLPACNWRR